MAYKNLFEDDYYDPKNAVRLPKDNGPSIAGINPVKPAAPVNTAEYAARAANYNQGRNDAIMKALGAGKVDIIGQSGGVSLQPVTPAAAVVPSAGSPGGPGGSGGSGGSGSRSSSSASSSSSVTRSASPSTGAGPANNVSQLYGVDAETIAKMNAAYQQSPAVTEALAKTQNLLDQLTNGKTPYGDQIADLIGQISNRDPFAWDPNTDTLFQQALSSAMYNGRQAMQDTMGQAAALTGGYGSTYATNAANGAYNQYIQAAYDNLPDYWNMAFTEWQEEGNQMRENLNMLQDADNTYYDRLANSYGAQSDWANNMYSREYGEWGDAVSQAQNYAQMLNSNYWQAAQLAEEQRQFNEQMAFQRQQAAARSSSSGSRRSSGSDSSSKSSGKALTQAQMQKGLKIYNESGWNGVQKWLDSFGPEGTLSEDTLDYFADYLNEYGTWERTLERAANNRQDFFDEVAKRQQYGQTIKAMNEAQQNKTYGPSNDWVAKLAKGR